MTKIFSSKKKDDQNISWLTLLYFPCYFRADKSNTEQTSQKSEANSKDEINSEESEVKNEHEITGEWVVLL